MAKDGLIDGFVPATSDGTDSQIIVDSERADDLDGWTYLTRTLQTESHTFYRLTGMGDVVEGAGLTCSTCERCEVSECLLWRFSCLPVSPYECFWRDGRLRLWFAIREIEELEEISSSLREIGYAVDLKHLSRSDSAYDTRSNAHVNLEVLTSRQREAVRLATEGNYFASDGADADELATKLGVSTSTFSKHVRIGVDKIITQLL